MNKGLKKKKKKINQTEEWKCFAKEQKITWVIIFVVPSVVYFT